jgi:hypothetical protein
MSYKTPSRVLEALFVLLLASSLYAADKVNTVTINRDATLFVRPIAKTDGNGNLAISIPAHPNFGCTLAPTTSNGTITTIPILCDGSFLYKANPVTSVTITRDSTGTQVSAAVDNSTLAISIPANSKTGCMTNGATATGPKLTTIPIDCDAAVPPPHIIPAVGNISGVWANEGGDKVSQDELRASNHTENLTGSVTNRAWDGAAITVSGAHNEVVSFDLVLEAAQVAANNVNVRFDTLTGPNGSTIHSLPASGDGVFDWSARPIENFFVRYLPINGLSFFGYGWSDERVIPTRLRTPWGGNGQGTWNWYDRPDHDKNYPDIMVPLELSNNFVIAAGTNQSIWTDIYIPKSVASGTYTGNVIVTENEKPSRTIPVTLVVQNFNLPDTPTTKQFVNVDTNDIMWRYVTGHGGYVNAGTPENTRVEHITDKYFQLFHRHKIDLVGENICLPTDAPCAAGIPRLTGDLYTPEKGYDGPGVRTPVDVYSIGTYGTWGAATYGVPGWKDNQALFNQHTNNWASWFAANMPNVHYFLYLEDEPPASDMPKIRNWVNWLTTNPGAGRNMKSLSTLSALYARTAVPDLSIPVTLAGLGGCIHSVPCDVTGDTQSTADLYNNTPGKEFWMYNTNRPGTGTANTEDDGTAMRTIAWAQYKMKLGRWFYWYANISSNLDTFTTTVTWGSKQRFDNGAGWTGNNGTTNGNGMLVYPGTDINQPQNSYGVDGPFASLRLKEWRRGIQDADYLALASRIDPITTRSIINRVMPRALWENPAPGGDPSWFTGTISWSANPDDWEAARAQLGAIISGFCSYNPGDSACSR